MKQALRQYGAVAALLAVLTALAVLVTVLTGGLTLARHRCTATPVLATTYPIYVAAQNIIGSDTAIALSRLDGAASGCLHDYQMSPSDRRAVEEAEIILMNGAGAETFLHGIVDESKCVDTSAGIDLLCASHDHEGGEEHHHEEYNEHLWLSPARYEKQVLAVMHALIEVNPINEAIYRSNAENYLHYIDQIKTELTELKESLSGRPCVLFHDSMAYLAVDLGLDVKLTLSVEGESGLSAADLKQVEALAEEYPDLRLFYDTQYALRYEGVGGTAVSIHTAVVGEGRSLDWVTAMQANLNELRNLEEVAR